MTRRVVAPASAALMHIYLETIGINADQEPIDRPQGYPCYHWLHTLEGEGEFGIGRMKWKLPPRTGILVHPNVPHRYHARTGVWQTAYVTLECGTAPDWIAFMFSLHAERVLWDAEETRIVRQWTHMLQEAEAGSDRSGWDLSVELYRFLTLLKTAGRTDHRPSMTRRMEKMQDLLEWLEQEYPDPDLGLAEMAAILGIGERQLNERFRQLFGQTAYAYLIRLRLRKAKEMLPVRANLTVGEIGASVGFRDASHFVATFRKTEGLTPERYRLLHGANMRA